MTRVALTWVVGSCILADAGGWERGGCSADLEKEPEASRADGAQKVTEFQKVQGRPSLAIWQFTYAEFAWHGHLVRPMWEVEESM
jgi:hypothetical protein